MAKEESVYVFRFVDGSTVEVEAQGVRSANGAFLCHVGEQRVAVFTHKDVAGWWQKDAYVRSSSAN
ncbi:MAG: hypothetical protein OXH41_05665 [Chloroflexi bacterium]|nr:hypothetical protein [Chloroflexota bacterium]